MMTRDRLCLALDSLLGLRVGDAFGERFFGPPAEVLPRIYQRVVPAPEWRWTDDTAMAAGVVDVLKRHGRIDQDGLAAALGECYLADPRRGYAGGAHELLGALGRGAQWRPASYSLFNGLGSFGNGAAMRVAPVGAYFADDPRAAAEQARLSAEVTHAHTEGIAGAVAVAVAAAYVAKSPDIDREELFAAVLKHTPRSETRARIMIAKGLPADTRVDVAAEQLGTGARVTAMDTVPFCIWAAAKQHNSYEDAMWTTVAGLGDRDTTCAIVGGILGTQVKPPESWIQATEPLDLRVLAPERTTRD